MSEPADLDRRFYAFAIDRAVAWGLDAAVAVVIVQLLGPDRLWVSVAVVVGVVLLVGAAFAVVLGLTGGSPGNAVAGIRVVRDGSGTPIGVGPALVRQLLLGLAGLPTLCLGVATLAWTAVMDPGGRRRGWHDHVVGSVVVDARPVPAAEPEPESGPRHVVNLTALRLVPAPTAPPPPRHAAPEPVAAAPPRQRLGYPLVPEPLQESPRRWRIGFDTGESLVVEGLALVGRRPEARVGEQVRHLVPLPSEDMSLSKTHAQLQVAADGALVVMDRGSTNGSILIRQGVPRGLLPGKAATLVDGDRVRFGDREMSVVRES